MTLRSGKRQEGAEVVVLGSLHLDIVVRAPRLPLLGETLPGLAWELKPGGKGGNQAIQAAAHGVRVAMVGATGDDDFGDRLRQHLKARGVASRHVSMVSGAKSGMSVATVNAGGDYGAVIVSGVNLALDAIVVEAARPVIESAKVLVLQNEVAEAVNRRAAELAAAAGGTVVLNAAPARHLGAALVRNVDILVVNAVEAEMLGARPVHSLSDAGRAARRLLELAPVAIVTVGPRGLALARRDGVTVTMPAERVRVASAHGAGDAFIGALAARLASGDAIVDAVRYAARAATAFVAGETDTVRPPERAKPGRRHAISRRRR